MKFIGKIKLVNPVRHYGFIISEHGEIFFGTRKLMQYLKKNDAVEFEVLIHHTGRPRAINIKKLENGNGKEILSDQE